jgi:hypothetical protein
MSFNTMHTAIVATLKQKTNVPTSPSWLLLTFDFEGFLALKSKFTSGKLSKYFPIFSFEPGRFSYNNFLMGEKDIIAND